MKKSISTRIRVTKNGKIMRRRMGQCHFRAKRTATQTHRHNESATLSKAIAHRIAHKETSL